ncbi:MAG: hypothetical protein GX134_13850 [candidate division WS1 bacterium]|jgi:hypothetical protein|nr:hypothetical protein [candidate division WS1 bacterium]
MRHLMCVLGILIAGACLAPMANDAQAQTGDLPELASVIEQITAGRRLQVEALRGYLTTLRVLTPDQPSDDLSPKLFAGRELIVDKCSLSCASGRYATRTVEVRLLPERGFEKLEDCLEWSPGDGRAYVLAPGLEAQPLGQERIASALIQATDLHDGRLYFADRLQLDLQAVAGPDPTESHPLSGVEDARVAAWQAMTGLDCLRLECTLPGDPPGTYILWVAPDRGWRVVRSEAVYTSASGQWDRVTTCETSEFRLVGDQQWVPSLTTRIHFTRPAGAQMPWRAYFASLTICRDIRAVTTDSLAFEPLLPNATLLGGLGVGDPLVGDDTRELEEAARRGEFPFDLDGPTLKADHGRSADR